MVYSLKIHNILADIHMDAVICWSWNPEGEGKVD